MLMCVYGDKWISRSMELHIREMCGGTVCAWRWCECTLVSGWFEVDLNFTMPSAHIDVSVMAYGGVHVSEFRF